MKTSPLEISSSSSSAMSPSTEGYHWVCIGVGSPNTRYVNVVDHYTSFSNHTLVPHLRQQFGDQLDHFTDSSGAFSTFPTAPRLTTMFALQSPHPSHCRSGTSTGVLALVAIYAICFSSLLINNLSSDSSAHRLLKSKSTRSKRPSY
jgi:hypothetical protein